MIALWTDEHFMIKNADKQVFEDQIVFFEKQVFPFLLENKVKYCVSLGDINHERTKVDSYILEELQERFFKWFEKNKIKLYLLLGNHSTTFKNTNSHNFLKTYIEEKGYKFIKCFYSTPTTEVIGKYVFGFIPWQTEDMELVLPNCDVLCIHADVIGAKMNQLSIAKKGYDPKIFNGYKLCLSGHYHTKSEIGNVKYLGSPYQMDWGNCGEEKGFYILGDNFDLTFIENCVTPKHIKIVYSEEEVSLIGG